jgi:hypothetical protein
LRTRGGWFKLLIEPAGRQARRQAAEAIGRTDSMELPDLAVLGFARVS